MLCWGWEHPRFERRLPIPFPSSQGELFFPEQGTLLLPSHLAGFELLFPSQSPVKSVPHPKWLESHQIIPQEFTSIMPKEIVHQPFCEATLVNISKTFFRGNDTQNITLTIKFNPPMYFSPDNATLLQGQVIEDLTTLPGEGVSAAVNSAGVKPQLFFGRQG